MLRIGVFALIGAAATAPGFAFARSSWGWLAVHAGQQDPGGDGSARRPVRPTAQV